MANTEAEWDTLTLEQKLEELGYPADKKKNGSDRLDEGVLRADAAARLHEVLNGLAGASSIIAEAEEKTEANAGDCEVCKDVHLMIVADDDARG